MSRICWRVWTACRIEGGLPFRMKIQSRLYHICCVGEVQHHMLIHCHLSGVWRAGMAEKPEEWFLGCANPESCVPEWYLSVSGRQQSSLNCLVNFILGKLTFVNQQSERPCERLEKIVSFPVASTFLNMIMSGRSYDNLCPISAGRIQALLNCACKRQRSVLTTFHYLDQ